MGGRRMIKKKMHFLSLMLGSVLVLMLPLLVWLTPDLRIKKGLLAFSRRLHARIRKTRYMHKFFFSSRRRHTRLTCDCSSDVCSSDLRPCANLNVPVGSARLPESRAVTSRTD